MSGAKTCHSACPDISDGPNVCCVEGRIQGGLSDVFLAGYRGFEMGLSDVSGPPNGV